MTKQITYSYLQVHHWYLFTSSVTDTGYVVCYSFMIFLYIKRSLFQHLVILYDLSKDLLDFWQKDRLFINNKVTIKNQPQFWF
jgi:hypothetical protein